MPEAGGTPHHGLNRFPIRRSFLSPCYDFIKLWSVDRQPWTLCNISLIFPIYLPP